MRKEYLVGKLKTKPEKDSDFYSLPLTALLTKKSSCAIPLGMDILLHENLALRYEKNKKKYMCAIPLGMDIILHENLALRYEKNKKNICVLRPAITQIFVHGP